MFMRMRFDTTRTVAAHATDAAQAHAMGCGTEVEPDPYARLWAERRAAACRTPAETRAAATAARRSART